MAESNYLIEPSAAINPNKGFRNSRKRNKNFASMATRCRKIRYKEIDSDVPIQVEVFKMIMCALQEGRVGLLTARDALTIALDEVEDRICEHGLSWQDADEITQNLLGNTWGMGDASV